MSEAHWTEALFPILLTCDWKLLAVWLGQRQLAGHFIVASGGWHAHGHTNWCAGGSWICSLWEIYVLSSFIRKKNKQTSYNTKDITWSYSYRKKIKLQPIFLTSTHSAHFRLQPEGRTFNYSCGKFDGGRRDLALVPSAINATWRILLKMTRYSPILIRHCRAHLTVLGKLHNEWRAATLAPDLVSQSVLGDFKKGSHCTN